MSEPNIIEGEVIDASPAPATGTSMVAAANPYMSMAQTAMTTGRGMDQLEKFLELQMRWDAEQARRAFVAAMAAFKAEPIEIRKTKLVEFETNDGKKTSYRHAPLAEVVDAVVGAMGKHGLSHRWDVKPEGGQIVVSCILSHRDGHSESVTMQAGADNSGKKNLIQQQSSTVTYLQRYTLMAVTGVAAKDMDDDGVTGGSAGTEQDTITPEQVKVLGDLIDAYVANAGKFMDWIRGAADMRHVQELADIPASRFQFIHDQLGRIRAPKIQENANA
jgi:hypothetical protein